jgi:ZIP family zinc transporter
MGGVLATLEMSTGRLFVLAAIAGFTIFLGLPIGRLRSPAPRLRVALNAVAIGILVFLLWDVLGHANEPVETALLAAKDGSGTWVRFGGLAAMFAGGIAVGLVGLVYYDGWMGRRQASAGAAGRPPAYHLALLIAVGIGLHNFSEGLAIGQSAASGEIDLAVLLIIGFGLHNATEGFGIVGPLAGEAERPGWGFQVAMGLVGGAPTFLGTVVGHSFVNDTVFLAFLALAAGSILYVIIQLLKVAARHGHETVVVWCIFLGLALGFATDYVLVAAGA